MSHNLCAILGTTNHRSERERDTVCVIQSAARIQTLTHQKSQKGWHITGLSYITGRHISGHLTMKG